MDLQELLKDLQVNYDSQTKELEHTEIWDNCRQCKLEQRLVAYERIISIVSRMVRDER